MMAGQAHQTLELPAFSDPVNVLIVVAPYYREIADQLVAGAVGELEKAGASYEIAEVPGALEESLVYLT